MEENKNIKKNFFNRFMWMVWDTDCDKNCSVDMAFVFPTEKKALVIAGLLNDADYGNHKQHSFQVFKMEYVNF